MYILLEGHVKNCFWTCPLLFLNMYCTVFGLGTFGRTCTARRACTVLIGGPVLLGGHVLLGGPVLVGGPYC